MERIEELKSIVGELMKVDAETVAGSTLLNGLLASSMGRARLDATLRARLGVANSGIYQAQTFGELCQLLGVDSGGNALTAKTSSKPSLTATNFSTTGIAIGVDIQAVSALPEEADYWEGDFYQQHFTRQEIAYALLQSDPRESFAAAWCAKEALRKADDRWVAVDWKVTEIVHDSSGKPVLKSGDETIPCSVSLSHTSGFALAVVAIAAFPAPDQQHIPVVAATPPTAIVEGAGTGSRFSLAVSITALLVSLAAAVYSFLR